jgi:flagellar assembly protein FliH
LSNNIIRRDTLAGVRKADLADFAAPQAAKARADGEAALEARRRIEEETAAARMAELERAREDGRIAGAEEMRRETDALLQQQREELRQAVAGLQSLTRTVEQRLAADVLGVSLELARLVLRESLRLKPERMLEALREGMASLPSLSEQVTLVLHPADAQLLRGLSDDARALPMPWRIVEDGQMTRGGFKLETVSTEVDGTLEMRWQRVIAALGRDDAWD